MPDTPDESAGITETQIRSSDPQLTLNVINTFPQAAQRMADHGDAYEGAVRAPAWEGATAGAVITTAGRHNATIADDKETINALHRRATAAMDPVIRARTAVLDLIDDARKGNRFTVSDDLKVTAADLEYKPAAEQKEMQIRQAAQKLADAETFAASEIRAGAQPLTGRGSRGGIQLVDHHFPLSPHGPFPRDPAPDDPSKMTRTQAAAGLRDVNARIAAHNDDIPEISGLPLNDPRRTSFSIDTRLLNEEKQGYLDVLPPQHPPRVVTGPNNVELPGVPPGMVSQEPAKSGQGWIYPVAPGQQGIDPRAVSVRVMEPTSTYPNGYANYLNVQGQEVNPFTGRTVAPSDDYAHIPLPPP